MGLRLIWDDLMLFFETDCQVIINCLNGPNSVCLWEIKVMVEDIRFGRLRGVRLSPSAASRRTRQPTGLPLEV